MTKGLYLAAAAALALAACNNNRAEDATVDNMAMENDMVMDNMSMDNMGMANGMAGAPMASADFVNAAAASDMYEIESSRLASTKSTNADLKMFAQMLVADHTKATAALKAAAATARPAVTPSPAMTAEQTANMAALKAASAADFDQLYVSQQIPAHEMALAMLQSYAAGGSDEGIKAFAAKTAPVVQGHLERARAMKK